ncbi:PREDICTED: transcription intermediary factor 1-beta [Lepidothrix coronata]|uniref:Transcription intermediary factor 1-beta n=1 Tax=Lepidothrix coronata TaxID=321398 RepID=A0A6J0J848_9PASS|nr:PREDICTED: transcription intermediary factor 1-beta [Lepidothrix coronata]
MASVELRGSSGGDDIINLDLSKAPEVDPKEVLELSWRDRDWMDGPRPEARGDAPGAGERGSVPLGEGKDLGTPQSPFQGLNRLQELEKDFGQGVECQDTGNGFQLEKGTLGWDSGEKSLPVRAGRGWHGIPRKAVAAPSWKCLWNVLSPTKPFPGSVTVTPPQPWMDTGMDTWMDTRMDTQAQRAVIGRSGGAGPEAVRGDRATMSGPEAAAAARTGSEGVGKGPRVEPLGHLELLEHCGRCRERLSPQRNPRLLPCLHSVCGTCLGGDGAVFECPVCHYQCPLGDILDNFFLQDSGAGATAGPEPRQSCSSCEDNAAATRFCDDCAEPLCDTCVQAHLRVRYTRGHSVRDIGESLSPQCHCHSPLSPLSLCDTCGQAHLRVPLPFPVLSWCHSQSHSQCRSQSIPSPLPVSFVQAELLSRTFPSQSIPAGSVPSQSIPTGSAPSQSIPVHSHRLSPIPVHSHRVSPIPVHPSPFPQAQSHPSPFPQKVTEAWQEELERRLRALSELQKHHELVMCFVSRAMGTSRGTALLLSHRLIHSQIQRSLRVPVEREEPPGELKFQWDLPAWTKSAENFGTIISEWPLPRSGSPPPAMRPRDPPPPPQVVSNGQVTPRLLFQPPQNRAGGGAQEASWGSPPIGREALGPPLPPQFPSGTEGLECPDLSPPHLEPPSETPKLAATGPPENTVTGGDRRKPGNSPREEKFVKKLLIKRRRPRGCQGPPPRPLKVPRVSLERLELGLALDPALPLPAFRVLPGPSAGQFSVIVIEQGGTAQGTAQGTGVPSEGVPSEGVPSEGVPTEGVPTEGVPSEGVPVGWSCRVCGRAGAVVMCDRCQRCFHLHCHLPALLDVPSSDWTCSLCQELPPPSEAPSGQGTPARLSPLDQQRCELVLLELLCHEPCRALQRPRGLAEGGPALDLTLMRAKLQEKLSPPYRTPEEFARDAWRVLGQLQGTTEDKVGLQSLLSVQRFLETRLSRVFGDRKFWDHPGTPLQSEPPLQGGWDHPESPLASWDPNSAAPGS